MIASCVSQYSLSLAPEAFGLHSAFCRTVAHWGERFLKCAMETYEQFRARKNADGRRFRNRNLPRYREMAARYAQEWRKKVRSDLIRLMGGKCVRCGFSDPRALQLDHLKGGGSKERAGGVRYALFMKLIKTRDFSGFQLLCANCNFIKREENGEQSKKYGPFPNSLEQGWLL